MKSEKTAAPDEVPAELLKLLDTLVKFRDNSFMGCQEISENAVHWLKLKLAADRVGSL